MPQARAARILARCEQYAAKHGDAKYAAEAGLLRGEVQALCAELEQYESPTKLSRYNVMLDGKYPLVVGATFDRDERNGPIFVDRLDVHLCGIDVYDLLTEDQLDEIRADVLRQSEREYGYGVADAAIERYEDSREDRLAGVA